MSQNNSSDVVVPADIDNAPFDLAVSKTTPDELERWISKFTEVSERNCDLMIENASLKAQVKTSQILDDLIKPYAFRAFVFMCVYCLFVVVIICLQGNQNSDFHISDSVLQLMVGSTAVTVIGLVGMVLTGVFVGARAKK